MKLRPETGEPIAELAAKRDEVRYSKGESDGRYGRTDSRAGGYAG